jgi:hypothetical protein
VPDVEAIRFPSGALAKPHAIGEIEFIPTNDGGREGPTPSDRLHCPLLYRGELFDVILSFHKTGSISPGQRREGVPMLFLSPELMAGRIKAGDIFALRELRVVAFGKFTETFI